MGEIRALTALRGLAAMAVVLQHFSATAQSHAATAIPSLVPQGLGISINLNRPPWSTSPEFAAYFLFPLLLAVVAGGRRSAALGARCRRPDRTRDGPVRPHGAGRGSFGRT